MKPVVIYTRISSDRDNVQAGVTRQAEDCREYADKNGLLVVETVEDNNTSAYTRRARPGWKRVLDLVKSRQVEGILVWHTDRLYRHPSDLEEIIELVTDLNLTIYTVTAGEMDLNTATGRMVARLLGSVARNEVEHKAERQSRAHLELARQGRWQGGPVPIGYKKVPDTKGELAVDTATAKALQGAAKRIINGRSLKSTAEWFSARIGRTVRPSTLKSALTGPTVAGLRMHIPQGHRDKWAAARARRTVSGNLPMKFDTYEAQWPPILNHDQWNQVRSILLDPSRSSLGRRPEKSLLGGIIYCHCGTKMSYSSASYKCSATMDGCGAISVGTKGIQRLLLDALSARAAATENLTLTITEPDSGTATAADSLVERRRVFLSLFADGQISGLELNEQLARLDAQGERITAEQQANQLRSLNQKRALDGLAIWEQLRAQLDQNPQSVELTSQARTVITALVSRIVIAPSTLGKKQGCKPDYSRVKIEWKYATSK